MNFPSGAKIVIGFAACALSSGFSVRGRDSTQALSFASMAMLEMSPHFILAGFCGQALSTSNCGTPAAAAGAIQPAMARAATRTDENRDLRDIAPSRAWASSGSDNAPFSRAGQLVRMNLSYT